MTVLLKNATVKTSPQRWRRILLGEPFSSDEVVISGWGEADDCFEPGPISIRANQLIQPALMDTGLTLKAGPVTYRLPLNEVTLAI